MVINHLHGLHCLPLVFLVAMGSSPAVAQLRPDAGALQGQIERDLRSPLLPISPVLPAERAADSPFSTPNNLQFILRQLRFQGNRLVTDDEILVLLGPLIGQSLGQTELRSLSRKIAAHYRQQGWIVRVLLPPQDLTEGVLTIRIIESVFGDLKREGVDVTRIDSALVESRLLARQRIGAALNTREIDRGVLLADDLAGVQVQGAFQPGEQVSETNYVYRLTDEPLMRGDIKVDNHGSASTGQSRFSAGIGLLSPLGIGEIWQSQFAQTRGSDYARLSLSMPVGVQGWRADFYGAIMRYKVISPELASLELEGRSGTLGMEVSYPLLRSTAHNLSVVLGLEQRRYLNLSLISTLSDYASTSTQLALNWSRQDRFAGGGGSSGQLMLTEARQHDIRSGPQIGQEPVGLKLRYALGRQQMLGESLMLQAKYSGQWSSDTLDSAEKFSLGGPAGIRAYSSGEGSGASAYLLNLELRRPIDKAWTLSAFYDRGAAWDVRMPSTRSLQGAGLSLDFVSTGGAFASAIWARTIGQTDLVGPVEQDAQGRVDRHRLWVSAGWRF